MQLRGPGQPRKWPVMLHNRTQLDALGLIEKPVEGELTQTARVDLIWYQLLFTDFINRDRDHQMPDHSRRDQQSHLKPRITQTLTNVLGHLLGLLSESRVLQTPGPNVLDLLTSVR